MKGKEKSKEQLIDELAKLRQQIIESEKSEIKHQQIEKTLSGNEEKYRILVELAADGIQIETVEGRILECNTAGAKIYGYTEEEIIGLTIADLVPEEFAKKLPKIITEKETSNGIFVPRISKKKDGTIFPTEIANKIVNVGGKPRLIAYIRDISKRKEAEKKLRKARKMFVSLFRSSPEALVYVDEKGTILNINSRFTELFGYTLEEIKGKNINSGMIHPHYKIIEGKGLDNKALYKGYIRFETIRKKKDGTLFPVSISGSPVIVDDQPRGIIGTFQDITERKKTEETLRKSQQEFASLFNSSPQALAYLDPKSNIVNINPRFTELFGYTLEEVKGRKIDDGMIHPPDKMEEAKELTNKSFKGNFYCETVRKKKDGTLFPVSISGSQVIIDGQLKGLIGIFKDITERKKTEETLRKSQQEFAGVFRNSPEALVYVDENVNILNVNPRFTELFGYTLEEIKGRNLNDGMIHPPDKIEEGKKLDKIAFSKGYFNYETIRKKKDGTYFPVLISGSDIVIDGQLKGGIGTYIDITKQKNMEEKLKKLAHYDVLTGCCSRGYGLALLEQQIKTANRKKTPILLLYLDVDDFKYINDTFGHKEGDMVLKEGVKLFKSTLREIDIICRIGGDEFLLIFPDSSPNDLPLIRKRLSKNLEKSNQKMAKPYKIDFSIGLSYYNPSNPLSIEELIKIADENMYEEKKKKKEGK